MAELPGLRVGLALDSATFVSETRRVADATNRMGRDITAHITRLESGFNLAARSVKNFGLSLAAAFGATSLTGIALLGKHALDSAGNLAELAQQAGVATGELQALTLAGVQVGVSQEEMVTSLGQLGKRVAEAARGTGELAKLMKRYSIEVKDSAGHTRSSTDILLDLADAAEVASSKQDVLTISTVAMGRAGLKMVPVFAGGADAMREFMQTAEAAGLIIGDDLIRKADKASDAIATLQYAVSTGFQIGFVEAFNTELSTSVDALTRAREAGEKLGSALGTAFNNILPFIEEFNKRIATTNREIDKLKELWAGFVDLVKRSPLILLMPDIKPLTVDIKESTGWLKGWKEELADLPAVLDNVGNEIDETAAKDRRWRLEHQASGLAEISQQTISRGKQAQFQAAEDVKREEEKLLNERLQEQKRVADEAARQWTTVFDNALSGIQSSFTSTFEEIYSGGVTSFSDLASEIKSIFVRLAAELTTLMIFRPAMGSMAGVGGAPGFPGTAGGFGTFPTAVTNPAAGGVVTGPGGLLVGGGAASLVPGQTGIAPGFLGAPSGASAMGILGAGGMGAAGGYAIGGMFGGSGNIGGALGGGIGAAAGTAFFGPLGGLVGGAAGSLVGGFIGSMFGGGGGEGSQVAFGGAALGQAGRGGTGEAAKLISQVDSGLMTMLTARQEKLVDAMLRRAESVSVQYGEEGPSANDIASLTRARIGPAAAALGFGKGVAGAPGALTAEEMTENLQQAVGIMQAIEDIELGPVGAEMEALKQSFLDTEAAAKKFGIEHRGALEEQYRYERGLIQRQAASERIALEAMVGLRSPLGAALAQLKVNFEATRIEAERLGISTAHLSEEYRKQRGALREQEEARRKELIAQAAAQKFQLASQKIALGVTVGARSPLGAALAQLKLDMQAARAEAQKLDISTSNLSETYREQRAALIEQDRLQKEALKAQRLAQAAERDRLALSITEPFQQLLDPLQAFSQELTLGTLNPAGQMKAAQDEFRRIARHAQAGSTIAIQQLEGAGRAFIEQAGRFGASPALIEANLEVRRAIESVNAELIAAQREASRSVEDAIDKASRREVDTLKEMIKELQRVGDEVKRLRRP